MLPAIVAACAASGIAMLYFTGLTFRPQGPACTTLHGQYIPQLYVGPKYVDMEEQFIGRAKQADLDKPYHIEQLVPANMHHRSDTLDLSAVGDDAQPKWWMSHFLAAWNGRVTNAELLKCLTSLNQDHSDLVTAAQALLGHGQTLRQVDTTTASVVQEAVKHLHDKLAHAAALADLTYQVTYEGLTTGLKSQLDHQERIKSVVEGDSDTDYGKLTLKNGSTRDATFAEFLLGRSWACIETSQHRHAVLIGTKVDMPHRWVDEEPVLHNSAKAPSELNDAGLEFNIAVRGSYPPTKMNMAMLNDWLGGNLRMCPHTEPAGGILGNTEAVRIHRGYFERFQLLWPSIRDHVAERMEQIKPVNACRCPAFVVVGHSQGAALATLISLAIHEHFKEARVFLFTFASPAFMDKNLIPQTSIRHFRFLIDSDPVPRLLERVGMQHNQVYEISLSGDRTGVSNGLKAHSAYVTLLLDLAEKFKDTQHWINE